MKKRLDLINISILLKWKYASILKFRTHVYTVNVQFDNKYYKSHNSKDSTKYMYLVPKSPLQKKETPIEFVFQHTINFQQSASQIITEYIYITFKELSPLSKDYQILHNFPLFKYSKKSKKNLPPSQKKTNHKQTKSANT